MRVGALNGNLGLLARCPLTLALSPEGRGDSQAQ